MGKFLRFNVLLWCLAAGAALWLVLVPPFMDFWAASHWNKTPCHTTSDSPRYFYEVAGFTYNTMRRDFWQAAAQGRGVRQNHPMPFEPNTFCWVNPANPEECVLVLDAHSNFTNAGLRVTIAGLLIAAATGLTWLDTRKQRGKKARPSAGDKK